MPEQEQSQSKNILRVILVRLALAVGIFVTIFLVYSYLTKNTATTSRPTEMTQEAPPSIAPSAPLSDAEKHVLLEKFVQSISSVPTLTDAQKAKLLNDLAKSTKVTPTNTTLTDVQKRALLEAMQN